MKIYLKVTPELAFLSKYRQQSQRKETQGWAAGPVAFRLDGRHRRRGGGGYRRSFRNRVCVRRYLHGRFDTGRDDLDSCSRCSDLALDLTGRSRADFEFCYPAFVVSGKNEEQWEQTRTAVTRQIAFYGSTPAYRGVLEMHGWGDLQTELNILSKRGEWEEMGRRIDDDILGHFALVAEPAHVAGALKARFDGLVDRVLLTFPFASPDETRNYMEELRA